ncbi:MAG: c-type cytochrome [Nannocystaceae bacterium]
MKTILKLIGGLLVLAVLGVVGLVTTCALRWPRNYGDMPKPAITASTDPEVVARGKYLVNAVAHCTACHAPFDETLASKPGDVLAPKGGFEWKMGPLGTIRSANITPHPTTGVGSYTDGELARVIRHGMKRNGEGALFMFGVGPMSDEDLTAVISYLRTIPAVDNAVPANEIGLLGKVLFQGPMAFFVRPHTYESVPYVAAGGRSRERGRYLAEGPAFCAGCHSEYEDDGTNLVFVGPKFAGNRTNPVPDEIEPGYVFYPPNLTPDPKTGRLAGWTEQKFIERMRAGRVWQGSPMAWESYRNMTDEDLGSLWDYLSSLPPTERNIGEPRRKADEELDD